MNKITTKYTVGGLKAFLKDYSLKPEVRTAKQSLMCYRTVHSNVDKVYSENNPPAVSFVIQDPKTSATLTIFDINTFTCGGWYKGGPGVFFPEIYIGRGFLMPSLDVVAMETSLGKLVATGSLAGNSAIFNPDSEEATAAVKTVEQNLQALTAVGITVNPSVRITNLVENLKDLTFDERELLASVKWDEIFPVAG